MYDNYLLSHSTNIGASCNLSQVSDKINFNDLEKTHILIFQSKYSKYKEGIQILESKLEVAKYLLKTCEEVEDTFDILGYWKTNVVVISISIVISESAFITRDHILDSFKSFFFYHL